MRITHWGRHFAGAGRPEVPPPESKCLSVLEAGAEQEGEPGGSRRRAGPVSGGGAWRGRGLRAGRGRRAGRGGADPATASLYLTFVERD